MYVSYINVARTLGDISKTHSSIARSPPPGSFHSACLCHLDCFGSTTRSQTSASAPKRQKSENDCSNNAHVPDFRCVWIPF